MITTHRYLKDDYLRLPNEPGVYKFFDRENELIYVGKAKNLKKRVSSYFTKTSGLNRKTQRLVSHVAHIECTITSSEFDALLLENNLIKENQPKFNILLKDDKTFPFILITKEPFPRVISTRKFNPASGDYFGPFSSVGAMNNVLELIRKLYTIRTCKLSLTEKNIHANKFKVCLEYHIGNCLGPCEGLQSEGDYLKEIEQVRHILKGNISVVRSYFEEKMHYAAEKLAFERAQRYKEKLELLEKFRSKSMIVNPKITDLDVFGLVSDENCGYINYLQVKNGSIVFSKNFELKKKLDEKDEELIEQIVWELRFKYRSSNNEIVTEHKLSTLPENVLNNIPKIGDKKKLLDLSKRNALQFKKEKAYSGSPITRQEEVLFQLKEDLNLKELPRHIECFDNSNFQGTSPVAAAVVFKNGRPSKKDYRHFNIKTVVGPNDFASMFEIVTRRYSRLIEENLQLPDLIVIDGGKGQLSAACDALKALNIYGQIPIIGIAKKLEEIYFPEDTIPIHISKKSQSLMLIQRLRDEAHRFAITFHRNKRSKSTFKTELEDIPGIGKSTADELLKIFKSVNKIKAASVEELAEFVGFARAQKIVEFYK